MILTAYTPPLCAGDPISPMRSADEPSYRNTFPSNPADAKWLPLGEYLRA